MIKKKRKKKVWRIRLILSLMVAAMLSFLIGVITPHLNLSVSVAQAGNQGLAQMNQSYQNLMIQLQEEARKMRLNFAVPKMFQAKTLNNIPSRDKIVSLTFDDGPWSPYTEQILEILKKNQIKGTFFVVGKAIQAHPDLMKRVVAEGHEIGNHTWSHKYHRHSPAEASAEIEKTAKLVYDLTGVKTSLFRPPGGFLNNGLVSYSHGKKQSVIMWSADSNDYRRPPVDRFLKNVLPNVKPGGVILMHDGGGDRTATVKALPVLIAQLKKQGYKFATLTELMEKREEEIALSKK